MIFVSEERKFIFYTNTELYRKSLTIKLIASDGYTFCEDTFTVYFDLIPIKSIIGYSFMLIGPILGAIGMLAFRIKLY